MHRRNSANTAREITAESLFEADAGWQLSFLVHAAGPGFTGCINKAGPLSACRTAGQRLRSAADRNAAGGSAKNGWLQRVVGRCAYLALSHDYGPPNGRTSRGSARSAKVGFESGLPDLPDQPDQPADKIYEYAGDNRLRQ